MTCMAAATLAPSRNESSRKSSRRKRRKRRFQLLLDQPFANSVAFYAIPALLFRRCRDDLFQIDDLRPITGAIHKLADQVVKTYIKLWMWVWKLNFTEAHLYCFCL